MSSQRESILSRLPLGVETAHFDLYSNREAVLTLLANPQGKHLEFLYPIENPFLQKKIEEKVAEQNEPISEKEQKEQNRRDLPDFELVKSKKKKLI